jgi:hypothetical protein
MTAAAHVAQPVAGMHWHACIANVQTATLIAGCVLPRRLRPQCQWWGADRWLQVATGGGHAGLHLLSRPAVRC